MQSQFTEDPSAETPNVLFHSVPGYTQADFSDPSSEECKHTVNELTQFHSHFVGCMDMYAPAETVAAYLDVHQDWFCRCAQPMKVEPLGDNGYALVIGKFGSFGYEVEPKIGLHLLPQDAGIYRIETIPVPGYLSAGYEVDFRAALELVETAPEGERLAANSSQKADLPDTEHTQVQWHLDLTVTIQFPRFIQALPKPLIQKTGDRLLHQIVRQVSRRLTHKVQDDFHTSRRITLPKQSKKHFFWQVNSQAEVDSQDS
jgi:hypothetical protein